MVQPRFLRARCFTTPSIAEIWGEDALEKLVETVKSEIELNGLALHLVDERG